MPFALQNFNRPLITLEGQRTLAHQTSPTQQSVKGLVHRQECPSFFAFTPAARLVCSCSPPLLDSVRTANLLLCQWNDN